MSGELDLELPDEIGSIGELPSPPGVVVEILRLTRDDDAGVDDFVRVISKDPALAAKLIQLSNSSMFAVGTTVETIERACVLVGLQTVQIMALSFSLTSWSPGQDSGTAFSLKEYWARSLIAAVAGRSFSKRLRRGLDDEAFLCGLLSQIGLLAILQSQPDAYAPVLERSEDGWPSRETEAELLGYDRACVGAALLQSWGLPSTICLSVRYVGETGSLPAAADDELRRMVELLRLAELTTSLLRGESKGSALAALRSTAETAGLSEDELDAVLTDLETEISETAELLDVELEAGASHSEILEAARQQVMRISLGTAADLKQAERRAHTLEDENRELAEKASKDKLTGIPNRASFDEILAAGIERQREGAHPGALGLLMIDADHFKRFNDEHGHLAGDEVLKMIARILGDATRVNDVPARYGGEEFAVIVPAVMPGGLEIVAERVRQAIEFETLRHDGKQLEVTVSIGGACLGRAGSASDAAKLIEAADERLYEAKHAGRNRCAIAHEVLHLA